MSGVEAASAVALHLSTISTYNIPHTQEMTVHHIHSRPFWTLPTYLPHESSESGPSFLPLDLAMYNLGRRPPGPIEYSLGPIPQEKAVKTNNYFHSLLGDDYEKYAHMDSSGSRKSRTQPPWVAIGNDYAEFVRSGRIQTSMGRVTSIHSGQGTGVASLQYEGPQGSSETIDNVAAIVMATGFTPYKSLSLLPDEVLATLDYSETDPFSPLILDKGGTIRSEVSDVGFVGFYRGPYWGVMEMQARFLGKLWSGKDEDSVCTTENQMQGLRSLRLADPKLARGQFPMGDYVGLMEYFAKDLDISRSALDTGDSQSGPAVPARYLYNKAGEQKSLLTLKSEARKTLDSLHDALVPSHDAAQKAAASAIFRALHGTWKYCKQTPAATGCESFSGTLAFHPRYPTSQAHDREYLCVETHDLTGRQPAQGKVQSILRLAETCNDTATSRIEVWSSDLTDELSAGQVAQVWELMPLSREKEGDDTISGNHIISSKTADSVSGKEYLYTFHFEGVSISSWTCVELESGLLEDTTGAVGNGHKRESSVYSYVR